MPERTLSLAPSSNIAGATWDSDTLECIVSFKSGGRYAVVDVSEIEAQQFESAPSPGKFYNAYFKDGKVVQKL